MAKPTSPTRWADTASTNRTAIDTGLRDVGFPAGAIIPAGENNQRQYEVGEWLTFFANGGSPIPFAGSQAVAYDETGGTIDKKSGAAITTVLTSGGSGSMVLLWPTVFAPGVADKVAVNVNNITAVGTLEITWRLYDSTSTGSPTVSTAARSYTAADDGTAVDQSFLSAADLAGPVYLVAVVDFTTASDSIEISIVKLHLD